MFFRKPKAQKAIKKRSFSASPTRVIAVSFAAIILLGAVLLSLPVASRSGESCGFLPALFTSTSSTCVTGLTLFDTWTQWSGFGQIVIISLIEIGGLGFMSAASLVVFLLRRKVGLKQRMLMAQALSVNDMESVIRLQKWVIFGSLGIQLLGATVLTLRFLPQYGFQQAAIWGIFHSISAFCNAGFDIFGSLQPGGSVSMFQSDPVVLITLMVLITVGALGFFVWEEVVRLRRFRKFSVYTKLVLTLRFLPQYGFQQAAIWGIFHSISAFCNAGFDIFGSLQPGGSVSMFQSDPVVLITLMVLITVGALGFFVWEEVVRLRRFRKFSVYTKLVLIMAVVLLVGGALLFMVLEWNNPATLGNLDTGDKVVNAFFQSTTLRTAGFAGLDQGALTDGGKAVSMFLMLIGGASGSTAGGLKTVTFVVLLLFVWSRARGKRTVHVFRRSVAEDKIMDAMTIALIMIMLALAGATVICATSPIGFTDSLFESVSALATVGLTTGVTTALSIPAQIVIILFMYFGRVGILTISLGFLMGDRATERFRYAQTNLLIG